MTHLPVLKTLLSLVILIIGVGTVEARDRGEALIRQAHQRIIPQHETRQIDIFMMEGNRVTNQRQMEIKFLVDGGVEKTLAVFTAPASIAGNALLLNDAGRGENQIWSYSPTDRRVRRISGQLRRNYFMGTEFAYEDFEGFRIGSRAYTYIEDRSCGNARCHVIDGIETDRNILASTGYSKRRYFLDTRSLYPVIIEYYTREGRHCKTLRSSQVRSVGAYLIAGEQHMINHCAGRSTRFVVTSVDNQTPINPNAVSRHALGR